MQIVSALFVENFQMRQAPGPSTRIDLTGAMFSAVVLTSLPELLRFASAWRIIIYCIIVLLIINYRPNGIFGDWEISRLWKKRKPAGETKA